ncbi:MAG: hypothetical protein R3A45_12765 [Bdellovibrionota bacterium]
MGQGDVEVSFASPRFTKVGNASSDSFQFNLGANYFMTDILAPGLDFNFVSGGADSFEFIPNIKAYLPMQTRILPYMKAGLGYSEFASQNFLALVLAPGVNYMLSNSVAIGAQLNYELDYWEVMIITTSSRCRFSLRYTLDIEI